MLVNFSLRLYCNNTAFRQSWTVSREHNKEEPNFKLGLY